MAAFDASPSAKTALDCAVRLAKAFEASLEVVNVETPAIPIPYRPDLIDSRTARIMAEQGKRFRKDLLDHCRKATRALPARRVRFKKIVGWPEDELLGRARAADLVVCGTHGRGGIKRFLLGSVAERLMRRSPAPVLCLQGGTRLRGRVLAPYNLWTYADSGLQAAFALSQALKMPLTSLYVASVDDKEVQAQVELAVRMAARLGDEPAARAECRIRRGDPRVEIAAEAETGRYGLVVLSSHVGDSWADRALGGTAERLLRRTRVPVMTVPPGTLGRPGGRRNRGKPQRTTRVTRKERAGASSHGRFRRRTTSARPGALAVNRKTNV